MLTTVRGEDRMGRSHREGRVKILNLLEVMRYFGLLLRKRRGDERVLCGVAVYRKREERAGYLV
jgi:hypothetical protein